jgi:hypothetical protein
MTIAAVGSLGTAISTSSGTTLVITTSAAAAAGSLVIVGVAKDNTQTTDGQTTEVTRIEDSGGNGWRRLGEYCNGQTAAAAGAVVSLWSSVLGTAIANGGTITITMDTTSQKAAAAYNYSLTANRTVELAAAIDVLAGDGANLGSQTISGLTSQQYLFLRAAGREAGNPSVTPTASWAEIMEINNTSTMSLWAEGYIFTGTTATSNPTTGVGSDYASVMVALIETPPAPVLMMSM